MLTYCTSNGGRLASSFNKRHYTKGHFSDPVGKVNTTYKNYKKPAIASTTPKQESTTPNEKAQSASSGNNTSEGVQNNSNSTNTKQATATTVNDNNNAPVTGDNNASAEENASASNPAVDYTGHGDRMAGPPNNANGLLLGWILCLGLAILIIVIYYAILIGGISTGGAGTGIAAGCIVFVLATMLFIAAIVLFVLWIVAIAR